MTHPTDSELALYSGGDLGTLEKWRVRRHLYRCESCRGEVEGFRAAAVELRNTSSELPFRLDWERVSAEMSANIHLGLEAAECVMQPKVVAPKMSWRAAAVMTTVSLAVVAAWWLNPPRPAAGPSLVRAAAVEIDATAGGLEVKENGNVLVLMNGRPGQTAAPLIVSSPGTLRARYVDFDTGQITINNVYAE